MKKVLQSIVLTSTIAVSMQAGGTPVCDPSDMALSSLYDKRYQQTAASGQQIASSYFDTKTIKIDKKNKAIDVWIIYALNVYGREFWINQSGNEYQNLGVKKLKMRFFYAENTRILLEVVNSNCNGSTISTTLNPNPNPTADSIVPNSLDEILIEDIKKKYNLK